MKSSWIHIKRGTTTRQARVGTIGMHEELFGRQGFFGPVAMLYHNASPNAVLRVEGPLVPSSTSALAAPTDDLDDPRGDPLVLIENADMTMAVSRRRAAMPFAYRNADGDLLYFVHRGTGHFASEFGPLAYEPGDYIFLPKGTTFQIVPDGEDNFFAVIETVKPLRFCEHLQVGRHVPFDPSLLTIPDIEPYRGPQQNEWELVIKAAGERTSIFYANNPMNLIGWKGDLFPFKLNIRDIIPISSDRIHLAPSSWATFENDDLMIVTFVPQMAVADITAEELPSNHRNIDCDEVLFIHDGESHPAGNVMHMPQGFMHGPTQAQREMFQKIRTPNMRRTLTAVSVDTYRPARKTEAYRNLID